MNLKRAAGLTLALALVATAGASGTLALRDADTTRVTAYFTRTTGVYEGSDLRILGVRVGTVGEVTPVGDQVRVELLLDEDIAVPANARAVVVAPSVVADRYIQLAPAYTGGERLRAGAVLPAARNAMPLEVDQLYESITELSTALGPEGAGARGALDGLIRTGAENLKGNGKALGDSIGAFGKAARTLDRSSSDLFATLEYLQSFTTMLKENDSTVARTQQRLADVTGFLAEDKENLSGALRELGTALATVKEFLQEHRGALKKNVDALLPLTQTLVKQRASLAEAMDSAGLAAGNALAAYNPVHRTLDGRAYLPETLPAGPSKTAGLAPADPDRRRALPGLPLPAVGTVYGTPRGGSGKGGAR
ncbi:MCE family protein [Streptomyces sp. NPDC057638]|uniref:MCE family protein n=1 Tax=Streptomyces sp. NPDC057638 TaxID=3346190 RepID=UPI0036B66DB2